MISSSAQLRSPTCDADSSSMTASPSDTELKLQKLLIKSSRLTAQLSSMSTYPVILRSACVLAERAEELARKHYISPSHYKAVAESVKSETSIRSILDHAQASGPAAARALHPPEAAPPAASSSIDALLSHKKAELEQRRAKEAQEKTEEDLRSCVNAAKVPHYAQVVARLNEHRLKKHSSPHSFPIFESFSECSREAQNEVRIEQLVDCWNALSVICGENASTSDEANNVFGPASVSVLRPMAESWPNTLTLRSRKVLEMAYLKFIDRTLAQNQRDALLGGRPTVIDRIRAFCSIRAKRLSPGDIEKIETSGGTAPWMVLFYLLRSGMFGEMAGALGSFNSYYQRTDPVLTSMLKTFLDSPRNSMSIQGRAQMQAEYNQRHLQGGHDPFKMALLKVIGRCELHKKTIPDIIQSSEDYLWLQLWLIREDEPSFPSTFTLADLQRTIVDFGPEYFSRSIASTGRPGNPLNYFQMLVLTGQFERAVETLLGTSYHLEAINTALGCLYHGRLNIAEGVDLPKFSTDPQPIINYCHLITDFAAVFRMTADRPSELHYILTLTLAPAYVGRAQELARHMVVNESSSDLSVLLGDVLADGRVQEGLLKRFAPLLKLSSPQDYLQTIVVGAAERCVDEGRMVEALQLFNLSGQYDQVLVYLSRELSRAFVRPWNREAVSQLASMSQSIVDYYASQPAIQAALRNPSLQHTCLLLLRVVHVRGLASDGEWERALSSIELLDIIPMSSSSSSPSDMQALQAAAANMARTLDETVLSILSDLLLLAMQVLFHCYGRLRQSAGIDAGRQAQIASIRNRARSLLLLVGMLPNRVSWEVCGQMAKMEVTMV